MVKNKSGQVKVQQMAFMILGLTIFFVLVGLFALSFMFSGVKESKALLDKQQATLLVQKLANSPEFSCGGAFGTEKTNCVDLDKVWALKSKINDYSGFWDIKGIEILKIYPSSTGECSSSNFPNCEHLTILNSGALGVDKSTFVSLCRKESDGSRIFDKCEVGKLIVRFSNELK